MRLDMQAAKTPHANALPATEGLGGTTNLRQISRSVRTRV
jgi:hypothetical protein